jgi:uncharacterized protein (DUF1330 family)
VNPGYVIVDVEVTDQKAYADYRAKAPATIAKHGGRYLVRGGPLTHMEPGWDLHRFVLLEFPTVAAAKTWYNSPEYQAILPLRGKSARSRLTIVEGLDPDKPLPE